MEERDIIDRILGTTPNILAGTHVPYVHFPTKFQFDKGSWKLREIEGRMLLAGYIPSIPELAMLFT